MSTEMVKSFISDSIHLADDFGDFSSELLSGQASSDTIGAIFRAVHSIKGGAGFLIVEDSRLSSLTKFCHQFENLLTLVRDGKLGLDQHVSNTISKGLDVMSNDIEMLAAEQEISYHSDLIERFADISLLTAEEKNGLLIFRIAQDIKMGSEADRFIDLVTNKIEKLDETAKIVIDLEGKHKLSSLALGAVIALVEETEKIFFVNPSAFMASLFKRFNIEGQGICIRQNIEECL